MKSKITVILSILAISVIFLFLHWHKNHAWQQAIVKELRTRLVDPESAQIDFLCYAENYTTSVHYHKSPHAACAIVNAKNSVGGYTGQRLMAFHLSSDNKNAEIVGKEVYIPDICKDICATRAWGKTDDESEITDYIFKSKF